MAFLSIACPAAKGGFEDTLHGLLSKVGFAIYMHRQFCPSLYSVTLHLQLFTIPIISVLFHKPATSLRLTHMNLQRYHQHLCNTSLCVAAINLDKYDTLLLGDLHAYCDSAVIDMQFSCSIAVVSILSKLLAACRIFADVDCKDSLAMEYFDGQSFDK